MDPLKRAKCFEYTKLIEDYLIANGIPSSEAHYAFQYWYENLDDLILHEPPAYWYYTYLTGKYQLKSLEYHLHDRCFYNRYDVEESTNVGCFGCNRIFLPSEIVTWHDKAAVCPYCHQKRIVGNAYLCLDPPERHRLTMEQFEELITEAYDFWTVSGKYRLVDTLDFYTASKNESQSPEKKKE